MADSTRGITVST